MSEFDDGLWKATNAICPGNDQKTEMMNGMALSIQEQFGQIDIYVFDQILRGNIAPGMRVLDAGCGYGRNLVHLLREGCEVFALDLDGDGVEHVKQLAASLRTGLSADHFQVGAIEQMPFPNAFADIVICSSVLHFARDEEHFRSMLAELWRVLRPGGMLFCRLGSRIGMEFERVQGGLFVVGDGSEWFLVDEEMLMDLTEEMNAVLVDPLKTTIVQDYRCMTTWVLRKRR
jgi:SAM-dependent methyltransferase